MSRLLNPGPPPLPVTNPVTSPVTRPAPRPLTGDRIAVQRAGTHFHSFVAKNIPTIDPTTSHADKLTAVFAWMLDQNVYELADFLSGNLAEVTMSTASLGSYGITLDEVKTITAQHGAPGPHAGPDAHVSWLHSFIAQAPRALTSQISQSAVAQGRKATSLVHWRGLTPWGAGLGAELVMKPGGINAGSSAGGDPLWMKTVEQHVPPGGNATVYVRGHLLNYDLGGPGLDYNMVPITGKPANNVAGSKDANGEHYNKAEKLAKDTLAMVQSGRFSEGFYSVIPTYNRGPRGATAQVRAQVNKLRALLTAHESQISNQHQGQGAPHVTGRYQQLHQSVGAPVPNPLPPLTDQLAAVTMADVRSLIDQTLDSLRQAGHQLAADIDTQMDRPILDASTGNRTDNLTVADLLGLLDGNARTWEAEDTYIPTDLRVELKWMEASGPNAGVPQAQAINPIPVTLPTSPSAVWYRPLRSNEDA